MTEPQNTPDSNNESLGLAIVKGACNSEVKDLAIELSEFELDSLFDEGLVKEIPVIKLVIACRKSWKGIHDSLFLRKVAGFLVASPKFTSEEKEKFLGQQMADAEKRRRLAETLVLILDRFDDLEKPQILCKIFAAYVRGIITLEVFRRLAIAIDTAFVDDLKTLAAEGPGLVIYNEPLMASLVRTDLFEITANSKLTPSQGVGPSYYDLTKLGRTFIDCMNK